MCDTDDDCCSTATHNCCGPAAAHFVKFAHPPFGGAGFWQTLIGQNWGVFMPYELQESDTEFIITMPLPGFESKEVKVSTNGENILIEATREKLPESKDEKEKNEPRVIISMGRFIWDKTHVEVFIPIGSEIDQEKVKASFLKAILTVRFQKKPRKEVKVEG